MRASSAASDLNVIRAIIRIEVTPQLLRTASWSFSFEGAVISEAMVGPRRCCGIAQRVPFFADIWRRLSSRSRVRQPVESWADSGTSPCGNTGVTFGRTRNRRVMPVAPSPHALIVLAKRGRDKGDTP